MAVVLVGLALYMDYGTTNLAGLLCPACGPDTVAVVLAAFIGVLMLVSAFYFAYVATGQADGSLKLPSFLAAMGTFVLFATYENYVGQFPTSGVVGTLIEVFMAVLVGVPVVYLWDRYDRTNKDKLRRQSRFKEQLKLARASSGQTTGSSVSEYVNTLVGIITLVVLVIIIVFVFFIIQTVLGVANFISGSNGSPFACVWSFYGLFKGTPGAC